MSSKTLMDNLENLKLKRKNNEISIRDFYQELLSLLTTLAKELKEEDISEEDVKKQIPLVLVFLEEQFSKMKSRGH